MPPDNALWRPWIEFRFTFSPMELLLLHSVEGDNHKLMEVVGSILRSLPNSGVSEYYKRRYLLEEVRLAGIKIEHVGP